MTQEHPPKQATDEELGVASALIKARDELGYTQAQLAELSGISRSAIKGYETGRNMPGSRELKALCRVLGVSPTALLYGSDQAFLDLQKLPDKREGGVDLGRARWRLHAITKLLALEEVLALSQLARSIAVPRHGVERVNELVRVGDTVGLLSSTVGTTTLGETFEVLDAFVAALDAEEADHKSVQSGGEPTSEG